MSVQQRKWERGGGSAPESTIIGHGYVAIEELIDDGGTCGDLFYISFTCWQSRQDAAAERRQSNGNGIGC